MKAEIVERTPERVLRIEKTDSMGRTKKQREDMEKNDPRPPRLGEGTLQVHAICADEHAQYPKAMYRLALKDGKPAGDLIYPDYPMPYDLALQLGLADMGKRIGVTRDSPGNVILRHPWITKLIGVVRDDLTIDIATAKAEEQKLRAEGWVDHPSKIKGLPVPPAEQGFDPLPDEEPKPNGNGRPGKAA